MFNTVDSLISGHQRGNYVCPLNEGVRLLESLKFFTFLSLGKGTLKVSKDAEFSSLRLKCRSLVPVLEL